MSQLHVDWGKVKDIAATIRETVVIAGVLAGGVWAYYKFEVSENPRAKLDYERAAYEAKTFGLQIDMAAKAELRDQCFVTGTVLIRNIGVSKAHVLIDRTPPITIASVRVYPDGHTIAPQTAVNYWIDDPDKAPREEVTVTPGRQVSLAFAVPAAGGAYNHVRFKAPVIFGDAKYNPADDNTWSARAISPTCVAERQSSTSKVPAGGRRRQLVKR